MGQIESAEAAAETQTTITTRDTSKPTSLESALAGCFSVFHSSRTSIVCLNMRLKRNLSLCRVFLLSLQKLRNMEVNILRFAPTCFSLLLSTGKLSE